MSTSAITLQPPHSQERWVPNQSYICRRRDFKFMISNFKFMIYDFLSLVNELDGFAAFGRKIDLLDDIRR